MGDAGDDTTLRVRVERDFAETVVRVRVWDVPASDRYPDGVKYAMQYAYRDRPGSGVDPRPIDDDGTILRHDNFPDHPGAPHHHVHRPDGSVVAVDFAGVCPLFDRFKREVIDNGEPWH